MTKTELICSLIVMFFSLITATKILSDRVSERDKEKSILKIIFALILSVYSSFGLATFAEYYYSYDFKLWHVFLVGFCFFSSYFVVSVLIGLYKIKKDEERRWKEKFDIKDKYSKENSAFEFDRTTMVRDMGVELENCYRDANECCKIVSIEDARKHKNSRK